MITILRGLPGSGKSRYARALLANEPGAIIVSADDYFLHGDAYVFVPADIGKAHAACFRRAVNHVCYAPMSVRLIVDNTNVEAWETAPYVALANAFGLEHEILMIPCDVETAVSRNVHGVPRKTIERMAERLERVRLPPFWNYREIKT